MSAPTMTTRDAFLGRTFTAESPFLARAEDGARWALGILTGSPIRLGAHVVQYDMTPAAADLSLVESGRCPLLVEHTKSVDSLVGSVRGAAIMDGVLQTVVEFAPFMPEADRLWGLVAAGFPLSLSMGAQIRSADIVQEDETGRCVIRVTRWRLVEVSVVVYGRDELAHVRRLSAADGDPIALVRSLNESRRHAGAAA